MNYKQQLKTFSHSRPWSARLIVLLLSLIVLLSIIRLCLPFAISYGTISWFESQNVKASISDIDISLSDGTFSIVDFSGKDDNQNGFSIGRIKLAWQWRPLLDHQIIIDTIEIRSLKTDAVLYENGDMKIAGIAIKAASDEIPAKQPEQAGATPWDITLNSIVFSEIDLCLQQFAENEKIIVDYCGQLADFNWSGDISFKPSVNLDPSVIPLYIQGTLDINDIVLHNNQLKLNLLNIGSININNFDIKTADNINIHNIDINRFSILQRSAKTGLDDSHVFAFNQLNITPLKFDQLNSLNLGTIKLTGSQTYLAINKNGEMDFKQWLPDVKEKQSADKKEQPKSRPEPFNIRFDEFVINTDKHIIFTDNSLKEPFTADIHDINISFKQFDTDDAKTTSHMLLALAIGKHGSLKLDVDVNDLFARPGIKGKGEISGLDLRMFAPLTKQHIGHNIRSGQLDVDLKLNVDKGIIDSNMVLALHQFVLTTLSKEEAEKLNSEFGMPLNSALSLLRDKDNTIRLDIPVTGDIDSPEFSPRDAMVTASSKAITTAVLHYYTPFGLVFAAGSLFDLATALNFEPVIFEAGEFELDSSSMEQLDKLASLLNERPGIHLTFCGLSNSLDKVKLFPLAVDDTNSQERQAETKPISDENLIILKKLAESRSSNIKNYMVDTKGADAARLIECSPEYMPDEISGVKINI